jgi:phosphate:Na+ symporter
MKEKGVKFLDQTKEELSEIYRLISEMFDLAYDAFTKRNTENFRKISSIHKEIKRLISLTRNEHVARLSSEMYPVEVSKSIYSVLFSLQRVSDHIVNVAFSIRSTTGSKTEAFQAIEREKRRAQGLGA